MRIICDFLALIKISILLGFVFIILLTNPWLITDENVSLSLSGNSKIGECEVSVFSFCIGIPFTVFGIASMWMKSRILPITRYFNSKKTFLKISSISFISAFLFFVFSDLWWKCICFDRWNISPNFQYTITYDSFVIMVLCNGLLGYYNLYYLLGTQFVSNELLSNNEERKDLSLEGV